MVDLKGKVTAQAGTEKRTGACEGKLAVLVFRSGLLVPPGTL